MHIRYFKIVMFVYCFAIAGCTSGKITVSDLNIEPNSFKKDSVSCNNFWDSMKRLDLNCSYGRISIEERQFLNAFRDMLKGNYEPAESVLTFLAIGSQDTIVKKNARDILFIQLAEQAQWERLFQLQTSLNTKSLNTVKAFVGIQQSSYEFPEFPDTLLFEYSTMGIPMVDVTINGIAKKFWIDTGASELFISSDIAEECGIVPINFEHDSIGTATTKVIGFPIFIKNFSISKTMIKNIPGIMLDEKYLHKKILWLITRFKIDGVIGWRLLKEMNITFNYPKRIIIIAKPEINRQLSQNVFCVDRPYLKIATISGDSLNFFLDTGALFSSGNSNIFQRLQNLKTHPAILDYLGIGGSKLTIGKKIDVISLVLSNRTFNFECIPIINLDHKMFIAEDGVIGGDLLHEGILHLDYANRNFEFYPEKK